MQFQVHQNLPPDPDQGRSRAEVTALRGDGRRCTDGIIGWRLSHGPSLCRRGAPPRTVIRHYFTVAPAGAAHRAGIAAAEPRVSARRAWSFVASSATRKYPWRLRSAQSSRSTPARGHTAAHTGSPPAPGNRTPEPLPAPPRALPPALTARASRHKGSAARLAHKQP